MRPENGVQWWLRQGLLAVHAGDSAEACRCFQTVCDADPDNITALLWLAWLAPTRQESLALLSRVLELDPKNERAHAGVRWARRRPEFDKTNLDAPRECPVLDSDQPPATEMTLSLLRPFLQRLAFGLGTLLLIAYLGNLEKARNVPRKGTLVVVDEPGWFSREELLSGKNIGYYRALGYPNPTLAITPRVAERLLSGTGYTLDTLDPAKIEAIGRTVFLAATVMGREVEY